MRSIMRRVDRLQRLAVFECVGRLGSFSAAARELGLTQPAVTRQMRALETVVGYPLFHRSSNRSRLTTSGQLFHRSVTEGFDVIERGLDELDFEGETFELGTGPSMAHFVILPMLDQLRDAIKAIDIRITVIDRQTSFDRTRFNAITQIGPNVPPGTSHVELFPEVVVPVASRSLAAEWGLSHDSPPEMLVDVPLIHEARGLRRWMSWDGWFEANGLPSLEPERRVLLNNHPLVIQQAIAGQGVALGWRYLVDDMISRGLLARVGSEVSTGRRFFLTWPESSSDERCDRIAHAIQQFASGALSRTV